VNLRRAHVSSWSYFFCKSGSNESFRLMWQYSLLVLSNHICIQTIMMDLQPGHVYKILFTREGKVAPNSSLKLSAHHCCNDGKGGILKTSNCLFPVKRWHLLQNFSDVKKKKPNCLSLKEMLKQRLRFHLFEKIDASAPYLDNTTDLQLMLQWPTDTAPHFFLPFWERWQRGAGKSILSSKFA